MPGRSKILKNIGKKLIFYEPFSQDFFACENINKNGAEGASAGQYFINPTPGQEPFNERKLSLCSRRKQEQDKTSKTPWARRIYIDLSPVGEAGGKQLMISLMISRRPGGRRKKIQNFPKLLLLLQQQQPAVRPAYF